MASASNVPSTSTSPEISKSVKVETPAVTTNPPAVILTPVLAVTSPTESILVLSSLVNVPAIETLPLKVASEPYKVFAVIIPTASVVVFPVSAVAPVALVVQIPTLEVV